MVTKTLATCILVSTCLLSIGCNRNPGSAEMPATLVFAPVASVSIIPAELNNEPMTNMWAEAVLDGGRWRQEYTVPFSDNSLSLTVPIGHLTISMVAKNDLDVGIWWMDTSVDLHSGQNTIATPEKKSKMRLLQIDSLKLRVWVPEEWTFDLAAINFSAVIKKYQNDPLRRFPMITIKSEPNNIPFVDTAVFFMGSYQGGSASFNGTDTHMSKKLLYNGVSVFAAQFSADDAGSSVKILRVLAFHRTKRIFVTLLALEAEFTQNDANTRNEMKTIQRLLFFY